MAVVVFEDLSYINCKDLLESTGIKNVSESGGEISFSCPSAEHFHGDRSPSARMNSRTSAWLCHNCGKRGNAITFLAWHKSLPETVARRLLEERYGGGGISAGIGTLEDEVKRIMNPVVVEEEKRLPPAESWLEEFEVHWVNLINEKYKHSDYLFNRGFDPKTLEKWEIGYDQISDRITIPVRDNKGNLIGFKGRAYKENTIPKYMILGDYNNQNRYGFQPYQKSKHVFGLDKVLHDDGKNNIILVEGELNVIAMNQHGFDNLSNYSVVGIAGSEFSDTQRQLIVESCCSVVIYLDNDKAGEKGTKKVIEMLSPYMPIKVVQNAPGDAADLDAREVGDLIRNAEPALVLQTQGML